MSETLPQPMHRSPRQGIILRLVDLLSDNTTLSNEDAANAIAADVRTVQALRKSDSFRTLLAKAIKVKHGEALHAVESNRLRATNAALQAVTEIATAPEVLPSVKLEAAKIALNDWHQTQDRIHAPKPGQQIPGGTNVTVELTFNELQAARDSANLRGQTLTLEPSDVAHTPLNPFHHRAQQNALLSNVGKERDAVREDGE